jgi:hypothetical protein
MNKATIIANINGFITAVITQLKHRNSMIELINNLWSTTFRDEKVDSSLTPLSKTTPLQADINYDITLKRVGNVVFVQGSIQSNTSTPFSPFTDICNITDSNFNAKALPSVLVATNPFTGDNILLNFSNKIRVITSIPAFQTFYFNGIYFTND